MSGSVAQLLVFGIVLALHATLLAEVPEAVVARFKALSSFTVDYTRTTKHNPDPNLASTIPDARRATFVQPRARVEKTTEQLRYAYPMAQYRIDADPEELESFRAEGVTALARTVVVVGPDRGEQMSLHHGSRRASGSVSDRQEIPVLSMADIGLGRRLFGSKEFLNEADLRAMSASTEPDGDAVLTFRDGQRTTHTMRFARDYGYAMAEYRHEYSADSREEMKCEQFKQVADGVWVPFRVEMANYYRDSGGEIRQPFHTVLEIASFELSPDNNTGDGIRLRWPEGASVRDRRTGFLTDVHESQVITDEQWFQLLQEGLRADREAEAEAKSLLERARSGRQSLEGK